MSPIQKKIEKYMDKIKALIEDNAHLDNRISTLQESLNSINLCVAHMNDEDADYIQAVKYAIKKKLNGLSTSKLFKKSEAIH